MIIDSKLVKELRGITGMGIMDCKHALMITRGNIEAAINLLRKKNEKIVLSKPTGKSNSVYCVSGFSGNLIAKGGGSCVNCGCFVSLKYIGSHKCRKKTKSFWHESRGNGYGH